MWPLARLILSEWGGTIVDSACVSTRTGRKDGLYTPQRVQENADRINVRVYDTHEFILYCTCFHWNIELIQQINALRKIANFRFADAGRY